MVKNNTKQPNQLHLIKDINVLWQSRWEPPRGEPGSLNTQAGMESSPEGTCGPCPAPSAPWPDVSRGRSRGPWAPQGRPSCSTGLCSCEQGGALSSEITLQDPTGRKGDENRPWDCRAAYTLPSLLPGTIGSCQLTKDPPSLHVSGKGSAAAACGGGRGGAEGLAPGPRIPAVPRAASRGSL